MAKILTILLALVLAFAAFGIAGCGGDDEGTTSDNESTDVVTDEGTADQDAGEGEATGLTTEQEEQAIDIAGAYLAAQTDFTSADFEWTVEAAAQDNEGQWWARISANPNDMSLETEQVYVYNPAGSDFWFAHDMGTGIDPATDESFPEEVRDGLGY